MKARGPTEPPDHCMSRIIHADPSFPGNDGNDVIITMQGRRTVPSRRLITDAGDPTEGLESDAFADRARLRTGTGLKDQGAILGNVADALAERVVGVLVAAVFSAGVCKVNPDIA